jgi:hypothetical protein
MEITDICCCALDLLGPMICYANVCSCAMLNCGLRLMVDEIEYL